jgi:hypothetical protein
MAGMALASPTSLPPLIRPLDRAPVVVRPIATEKAGDKANARTIPQVA